MQTSESEEASAQAAALSEVLGRRIRKLRIDRSLTLDEVAARSGCSVGSLSQIERGIGNPSFNTLVKISHALEISVGRLLEAAGTADPVVRRSERKHLPSGSTTVENGTSYELLTPNLVAA